MNVCAVFRVQTLPLFFFFVSLSSICCEPSGGAPDGSSDAAPLDAYQMSVNEDSGAPVDAGAPCPGSVFAEGTDRLVFKDASAQVRLVSTACPRRFQLSSDRPLRDGAAGPRLFQDPLDGPRTLTGNLLFDGLHALALAELDALSVDRISDAAFDGGTPVVCSGGCYATGALWGWVWTRDIAYASALGLAAVDPERAANALEFKLSAPRGGGAEQIVQDTGTGGSYPVSTDRVSWALGARAVWASLAEPRRTVFAERARAALEATLAQDLTLVFDRRDGLYTGEQSFLDWRAQSYPEWAARDLTHIAQSKALSTNVAHLEAWRLLATLREAAGDLEPAAEAAERAERLRIAIGDGFRRGDTPLLSTFKTTALDPSASAQHDLLGLSLAIEAGVVDPITARQMLMRWPWSDAGPPVMWPQQQRVRIYHNRAIWPFVTAFAARAGVVAQYAPTVTAAVHSLMRGAALSLSNMENFEWLTGLPYVEDGPYSGPVINSERQLWSVAGYVSMVRQIVFGLYATPAGLVVRPGLTRALRRRLFGHTDTLLLEGARWRGRSFTVTVHLPTAVEGDGMYRIGSVAVDGESLDGALVEALPVGAHLELWLLDGGEEPADLRRIEDASDYRSVFGPLTPQVVGVEADGAGLRVGLSSPESGADAGADGLRLAIYRDGVRVADGLPGETVSWFDGDADPDGPARCYTVEANYERAGTRSQHAEPVCWWGRGAARILEVQADSFEGVVGGALTQNLGRPALEFWGDPGHRFQARFVATHSGRALLQLVAANGAGPSDTGLSCGVKRARLLDAAGEPIAEGHFIVPQQGDWRRLVGSTFIPVALQAGQTYEVVVEHADSARNMSFFEAAAKYTGGEGGEAGAFSRINVAALKVLSLD